MSTYQFGFMKGCSTLQQLFMFLNSIHEHTKAQTNVIAIPGFCQGFRLSFSQQVSFEDKENLHNWRFLVILSQ